ncbi:MAG: hypothetical protein WC997_00775 [Porticoccaceae bacterium]
MVVAGTVVYGAYSAMPRGVNEQAASSGSASQDTVNQNQAASGEQKIEGALVEGFLGNKIPLYLGDVVDSKLSASSAGKTEYSVRIKTADSFEKVDNWTRISYVNEGWDIRSESKTLLGGTMIIAHSDEFINTITYDEQDDGVLINYGISTK